MRTTISTAGCNDLPRISPVGLGGALVCFADQLSEPANRAALAFRAALERVSWPGVQECATSLCSTFLRFDPLAVGYEQIETQLRALLAEQDWYDAQLPQGRRLWQVPTLFDAAVAPQLAQATELAGLTVAQAIDSICAAPVRVLTIGFAPGQPYLGPLPEHWDIPRQTGLTPQVPAGALVVAVRQFVLFANASPTGWRHVGQTGFRCFTPETADPFALRPGDEMLFRPVGREAFENMRQSDPLGQGGARAEVLS